jgi:LytS/YehU family sensor histidine kinase
LILSAVGLGIGTLHEVTTSAIYYTILWTQGDFKFEADYLNWALHALPPAILSRFLEFWVLIGVLTAVMHYKQMREKQQQLAQLKNELQSAQLNALKKQLQPHFLFNTLNTVSALMDEDVNGARKVLSRLGQLLRITLDKEQRDRVALARELDYIRNYLDIESTRFRDRLRVRYDVPTELADALVPNMLLQPLVENAVKHGPDSSSAQVEVTVSAERRNGSLVLHVLDNGKGCTDVATAMDHGGIGLRNVHDRLALLYGDQARMELSSPDGRGFHVTLSLPFTTQPGS